MKAHLPTGWILLTLLGGAACLPPGGSRSAAAFPAARLDPPAPARASRRAGLRALAEGRWREAQASLESSLKAEPNQPEALYGLALACAAGGEAQDGLRWLSQALDAGFQDYHAVDTDPRLAPLRSLPAFPLLTKANAARQEAFDAQLEAGVRESYRDTPYRVQRFTSPRIILVSDLDERLAGQVAQALGAQEERHRQGLFPNGLRHAIVVQAPKPGTGAAGRLPGIFSPASRTLHVNVAVPAGSMLREFARALHYDDQAATGQVHAAWLREGIAALYEQATAGTGTIRGVPDWRLSLLKENLGKPSFIPLARLFTFKPSEMSPQATTEARYLLYWLQETGRLVPFYRSYVENYDDDSTGRLSLESLLSRPLAAVEKEWVAYLKGGR
jgi:hypothetical protein